MRMVKENEMEKKNPNQKSLEFERQRGINTAKTSANAVFLSSVVVFSIRMSSDGLISYQSPQLSCSGDSMCHCSYKKLFLPG